MVLALASTTSLARASARAPDAAPVHVLLGMVTCCGGAPGDWIVTVSGWVAHAPRSVAVIKVEKGARRAPEAPQMNRTVLDTARSRGVTDPLASAALLCQTTPAEFTPDDADVTR